MLCLLNVFQALFNLKQLFKDITHWVWEGRYGQAPRTVDTSGTLKLNPWTNAESWKTGKMKKACHHPANSKQTQMTATCWGLAHAYRAAPKTTPTPATVSVDTPSSAANSVDAPTPVTGLAAALAPAAGPAAKPENWPVLYRWPPNARQCNWCESQLS